MPNTDLRGLGVAVTRPAPLGEGLARRVEAAGGRALRFPAIEIAPPPDAAGLGPRLAGALADARLVVFASPTAAAEALRHLPPAFRPPHALEVAALGPGTAAVLRRAGWPVHHLPAAGQDSEALLALPALAAPRDWQVVILAGAGGRSLLADTLRSRGARVQVIECFVRRRPAGDAGPLVEAIRAGTVQLVAVTSAEACRNLLAMAGETQRPVLKQAVWITGHPRVLQRCRDAGLDCEWLLAGGMDDSALLEAIARWRAGGRP